MFNFLFKNKSIKNQNNLDENKIENSEKIEETKSQSRIELYRENKKDIEEVNINYKLPDINIIDSAILKGFYFDNQDNNELLIPLGVENDSLYYENLETMPNLIVGGTVMSGKSSFVHTIIGTILMREKPYETKLLIIDPKGVEYNQYNKLPHMLSSIKSNYIDCRHSLSVIQEEINNRLDLLRKTNNKTIKQYNNSVSEIKKRIPNYVVIIDCYDLISFDQQIANYIKYIADNGWSTNIFLIIVSNHPSSQVISSIIKSSIPARLCFSVPSVQDSIAVLDSPGANKLRRIGDALYKSKNTDLKQLNVKILDEDEITSIINKVTKEQSEKYDIRFSRENNVQYDENPNDVMYDEVLEFAIQTGKISTSLIQRRFRFGYTRAAEMMDLLERRGIVGPQNGSKPREVLIKVNESNNY